MKNLFGDMDLFTKDDKGESDDAGNNRHRTHCHEESYAKPNLGFGSSGKLQNFMTKILRFDSKSIIVNER